MKLKTKVLELIAVASVTLTGCALLANPTFDAVLQAVIYEVIGALLNKNPAIAPIVAQDAAQLQMLVQGNTTTTVAQLQTQADNVISSSKLSVNDKAAMEAIVAAASGLLATEAAQLPASAQSGLALVFSDIQNAANLYAAAPASARFRATAGPSSVWNEVDQASGLFGK